MDFIKINQSNILLALSSICFVILLFLLVTTYLSKPKKRALLFFTFATMLMLISSRYSIYYQDKQFPSAYFLAPFWKYLMFFGVLNVSYGFNEFLICLYKENHGNDKNPLIFNIVRIIIGVGHVLLIISQFTNLYYSYDYMNIYHREKYYALNYLIPILATIIQYSFIAKEFKKTNTRLMIPIILYFTLPVLGAIIQLFIQGLSLSNILIGGVAVLLYLFVIYDANLQLKEKEKTEADLKVANEIQQNEIPNIFPNRNDFDLYAIMKPAKEIGGDYFDYFLLDDNNIGLVVADVSGKGVPAALNMIKTKTLVKGSTLYNNNPAEVLNIVNKSFIDNNKLDMFVTIWFGILEISTGKLTFVNAGHEDAIIYSENKGFEVYKTKHGLPIGTMNDYKYENHKITLSKGDKLFLYTDGLIDSVDKNNKRYETINLLKILNKNKDNNVKDIVNIIKNDLDNYSIDCDQFDDITMLCFELTNNKKGSNNMNQSKKFKADLNEIPNVIEYLSKPISKVVSIDKAKKYYVVLDEIFSNIVNYGFKNKSEDNYIEIKLNIDIKKRNIVITFEDNGIEFNPLEKEDPNITLSAKERKEGGLGIYIVKNMMDKSSYQYKNNKNIFTIEKKY